VSCASFTAGIIQAFLVGSNYVSILFINLSKFAPKDNTSL